MATWEGGLKLGVNLQPDQQRTSRVMKLIVFLRLTSRPSCAACLGGTLQLVLVYPSIMRSHHTFHKEKDSLGPCKGDGVGQLSRGQSVVSVRQEPKSHWKSLDDQAPWSFRDVVRLPIYVTGNDSIMILTMDRNDPMIISTLAG